MFPELNPLGSVIECHHCPLSDSEDIANVVSGELREGEEGEEIVYARGGGFSVIFPSQFLNSAQNNCTGTIDQFAPRGRELETLGAADFGAHISVGDVDDNGLGEIAITEPSTRSVYVLMNFDTSSPIEAAVELIAPPESGAFGDGPVVFLDVDTTEGDELVVGDPTATPNGVATAGQATIFEYSDDEVFERRAILHDSEPEAGQNYGRALGVAEFVFGEDDVDILIVGSLGEAFTLFRTLTNGTDPRQ